MATHPKSLKQVLLELINQTSPQNRLKWSKIVMVDFKLCGLLQTHLPEVDESRLPGSIRRKNSKSWLSKKKKRNPAIDLPYRSNIANTPRQYPS